MMFGLLQLDTAGRHDEVSQLVRFLQAVEMIVTWRHKTSKIRVRSWNSGGAASCHWSKCPRFQKRLQ